MSMVRIELSSHTEKIFTFGNLANYRSTYSSPYPSLQAQTATRSYNLSSQSFLTQPASTIWSKPKDKL